MSSLRASGRIRTLYRCAHVSRLSVCTPRRHVVQSNSSVSARSPLDVYTENSTIKQLRRNGNCNYYRYQQKLWPSEEAYERHLTDHMCSTVVSTPLTLMLMRQRPQQVSVCEGRGAVMLLDQEVAKERTRPGASSDMLDTCTADADNRTAAVATERFSAPVTADELDCPITDKMITESDLAGTVLASARARARAVVEVDLASNGVPSARDAAGGFTWEVLGLDPPLCVAASKLYGPIPTRLQSRLLPALLHEDHNDVLFNGVTGSGKTSALLLALLQGIRSEVGGMNVLVAANSTHAMRLHDGVMALCRRAGGGVGTLVDRPAEDLSWIMLATVREDYAHYYAALRASLQSPHGPVRLLLTTADTLCELLFEKKLEFEAFKYLRRVYVDDVATQIPMLDECAPPDQVKERLRNPLAAELLLGTLHQLPGPHIRSILQLALVSADVDGRLKNHLHALCIKSQAHTTILSPVRLPSTIHCVFSFHLLHEDRYAYAARWIYRARASIPGRAVLFIPDTADVMRVRRTLCAHGMNVKLFSEVCQNGMFSEGWKFVLLKESEAFGVDIPLVSHVFITFAPRSWQSYLHMCGRTGRLGNVGWACVITDQREVKAVRVVAEDLQVDFVHHVVDAQLRCVDAESVNRLTRDPELYGMDPQYAVRQHYEVQTESPEAAYCEREFFTRPAHRQFQMEDYTPVAVQQRRFVNAKKLAKDVERNPSSVLEMQRKGWLTSQLSPTERLKRKLAEPSTRGGR